MADWAMFKEIKKTKKVHRCFYAAEISKLILMHLNGMAFMMVVSSMELYAQLAKAYLDM